MLYCSESAAHKNISLRMFQDVFCDEFGKYLVKGKTAKLMCLRETKLSIDWVAQTHPTRKRKITNKKQLLRDKRGIQTNEKIVLMGEGVTQPGEERKTFPG